MATPISHGCDERTGNVWRTTIRIVAALIGPGILLFPGAMACLGWVFGLAATLLFSSVTCLSTHLLAYCYGSGGGTNGSYVDAAKTILVTGKFSGSLTGSIDNTMTATMIWKGLHALGVIAFSFSFFGCISEIQNTIQSSQAEVSTLKKALKIGIGLAAILFILCGSFGYAAFGDLAPETFLNGFSSYKVKWLINIAHAALFIHLTASYQAYSQPLFLIIEKLATDKFPADSICINKEFKVRIPGLRPYKLNLFVLVWRTIYVITSMVISKLVPFSGEVVDLIGALGFWLLGFYFPVEMYFKLMQIRKWSSKWVLLQIYNCFGLIIGIAIGAASVADILDFKT
ncbi:Amino acid permease [Melia azedarach]|uniref:Amino acid permease n=1 Tax=Melia azedarach TaxID=155640 RepID=A0ACC1WNN2_MELAZ|nr:Amino acid permease [Melia azedarach]